MLKITPQKQGSIQKIANQYGIFLLFLFGSRVTGQTHQESDYDFGYLSERNLSLEEEGRLIGELMPIAEIKDERLINLVSLKKASPLLLYAAVNRAQLLYEKEKDAFAEFRAYAFKKHIENLPLVRLKAEKMGIAVK